MENFVLGFFSDQLSKFIIGFRKEQVTASLLSGAGTITDLHINTDIVNSKISRICPFIRISSIHVSKLGINITSLTNIKKAPVVITIDTVTIDAYEPLIYERPTVSISNAFLEDGDDPKTSAAESSSQSAASSGSKQPYGIFERIGDNLHLHIKKVKINYQSMGKFKTQRVNHSLWTPPLITFVLENINYESVDMFGETGSPESVWQHNSHQYPHGGSNFGGHMSRGEVMIYKRLTSDMTLQMGRSVLFEEVPLIVHIGIQKRLKDTACLAVQVDAVIHNLDIMVIDGKGWVEIYHGYLGLYYALIKNQSFDDPFVKEASGAKKSDASDETEGDVGVEVDGFETTNKVTNEKGADSNSKLSAETSAAAVADIEVDLQGEINVQNVEEKDSTSNPRFNFFRSSASSPPPNNSDNTPALTKPSRRRNLGPKQQQPPPPEDRPPALVFPAAGIVIHDKLTFTVTVHNFAVRANYCDNADQADHSQKRTSSSNGYVQMSMHGIVVEFLLPQSTQEKGFHLQLSLSYLSLRDYFNDHSTYLAQIGIPPECCDNQNYYTETDNAAQREDGRKDVNFPLFENGNIIRDDPFIAFSPGRDSNRHVYPIQAVGVKLTLSLPDTGGVSISSEIGLDRVQATIDTIALSRIYQLVYLDSCRHVNDLWKSGLWVIPHECENGCSFFTPEYSGSLLDYIQTEPPPSKASLVDGANITMRLLALRLRIPASLQDDMWSSGWIVTLDNVMVISSDALPRGFLAGEISGCSEDVQNFGLDDNNRSTKVMFPNDERDVCFAIPKVEDSQVTMRAQVTISSLSVEFEPILLRIPKSEKGKHASYTLVAPTKVDLLVSIEQGICLSSSAFLAPNTFLRKNVSFSVLLHQLGLNFNLDFVASGVSSLLHHTKRIQALLNTAIQSPSVTAAALEKDEESQDWKPSLNDAGKFEAGNIEQEQQHNGDDGGYCVVFCLHVPLVDVRFWTNQQCLTSAIHTLKHTKEKKSRRQDVTKSASTNALNEKKDAEELSDADTLDIDTIHDLSALDQMVIVARLTVNDVEVGIDCLDCNWEHFLQLTSTKSNEEKSTRSSFSNFNQLLTVKSCLSAVVLELCDCHGVIHTNKEIEGTALSHGKEEFLNKIDNKPTFVAFSLGRSNGEYADDMMSIDSAFEHFEDEKTLLDDSTKDNVTLDDPDRQVAAIGRKPIALRCDGRLAEKEVAEISCTFEARSGGFINIQIDKFQNVVTLVLHILLFPTRSYDSLFSGKDTLDDSSNFLKGIATAANDDLTVEEEIIPSKENTCKDRDYQRDNDKNSDIFPHRCIGSFFELVLAELLPSKTSVSLACVEVVGEKSHSDEQDLINEHGKLSFAAINATVSDFIIKFPILYHEGKVIPSRSSSPFFGLILNDSTFIAAYTTPVQSATLPSILDSIAGNGKRWKDLVLSNAIGFQFSLDSTQSACKWQKNSFECINSSQSHESEILIPKFSVLVGMHPSGLNTSLSKAELWCTDIETWKAIYLSVKSFAVTFADIVSLISMFLPVSSTYHITDNAQPKRSLSSLSAVSIQKAQSLMHLLEKHICSYEKFVHVNLEEKRKEIESGRNKLFLKERQRFAAMSISMCRCSGWIKMAAAQPSRQRVRTVTTFWKYWVVLRGSLLIVYTKPGQATPLELIPLTDSHLLTLRGGRRKGGSLLRKAFTIAEKNGSERFFVVGTEEEYDLWIAQISLAIKKSEVQKTGEDDSALETDSGNENDDDSIFSDRDGSDQDDLDTIASIDDSFHVSSVKNITDDAVNTTASNGLINDRTGDLTQLNVDANDNPIVAESSEETEKGTFPFDYSSTSLATETGTSEKYVENQSISSVQLTSINDNDKNHGNKQNSTTLKLQEAHVSPTESRTLSVSKSIDETTTNSLDEISSVSQSMELDDLPDTEESQSQSKNQFRNRMSAMKINSKSMLSAAAKTGGKSMLSAAAAKTSGKSMLSAAAKTSGKSMFSAVKSVRSTKFDGNIIRQRNSRVEDGLQHQSEETQEAKISLGKILSDNLKDDMRDQYMDEGNSSRTNDGAVINSGIEGGASVEVNSDADDTIEDPSNPKGTLSQSSSILSLDGLDPKPQSKLRGRISKISAGVKSVKIDSKALRQMSSSTYQGIKSKKLPRGPSFRAGMRRGVTGNQNDPENEVKGGNQRIKYVRKGSKIPSHHMPSNGIAVEMAGPFKYFTVNVISCNRSCKNVSFVPSVDISPNKMSDKPQIDVEVKSLPQDNVQLAADTTHADNNNVTLDEADLSGSASLLCDNTTPSDWTFSIQIFSHNPKDESVMIPIKQIDRSLAQVLFLHSVVSESCASASDVMIGGSNPRNSVYKSKDLIPSISESSLTTFGLMPVNQVRLTGRLLSGLLQNICEIDSGSGEVASYQCELITEFLNSVLDSALPLQAHTAVAEFLDLNVEITTPTDGDPISPTKNSKARDHSAQLNLSRDIFALSSSCATQITLADLEITSAITKSDSKPKKHVSNNDQQATNTISTVKTDYLNILNQSYVYPQNETLRQALFDAMTERDEAQARLIATNVQHGHELERRRVHVKFLKAKLALAENFTQSAISAATNPFYHGIEEIAAARKKVARVEKFMNDTDSDLADICAQLALEMESKTLLSLELTRMKEDKILLAGKSLCLEDDLRKCREQLKFEKERAKQMEEISSKIT